ncbi:MAG: hypothetical protein ABEJ71_04075 [Halodesulfurarchaeum sp.]
MTDGPDPDDDFSDAQKRQVLRAVAADLRGRETSGEAERVAATVQRVSDLYDPAEETTPKDIYLNMRTILRVTESGGLDR